MTIISASCYDARLGRGHLLHAIPLGADLTVCYQISFYSFRLPALEGEPNKRPATALRLLQPACYSGLPLLAPT
eukprot:1194193-Prorocentrum_minimum.AAC.8